MMRIIGIGWAVLWAIAIGWVIPVNAADTGGGGLFIVENGVPNGRIVIDENPTRVTRFAAAELQGYLEKITGALLPIETGPGNVGVNIFVGRSEYTDTLGIDVSGLTDGGYRIVASDGWMALLGPDGDYEPIEPWGKARNRGETDRMDAEFFKIVGEPMANPFHWHYMHYYPDIDLWSFDERGTLNAVYGYLEDLGVRWYAPGEIGEVIPRLASIKLPTVDRTVIPDFALRNFVYGYAQHGLGETGLWNFRLGTNPASDKLGHVQAGHGIKWVLRRPEMFEAHPEYYVLRNGERKHEEFPCLSSEGLFQSHLAYIRAMLDHYGEMAVNVDMADGFGGGICGCELCIAQLTPERGPSGRMSDYVWAYIDRLAREVYKTHPDRMIGALAYSSYREPPLKIDRMSPNLTITECRWRSNFHNEEEKQRSRDLRRQWLEKLPSGEYFVWDYYLHNRPGSRGIPVYFPHLIAEDLRDLKGESKGDMIEVFKHQEFTDYRPRNEKYDYDAQAVMHLNTYVTAKLWWDADTDVDALLEEYYTLYFGPAAQQMREFIEYCESNWPLMRQNAEPIVGALQRIEAAQKAVDPDSIYGQRIARVAEYISPLIPLKAQLDRPRTDVLNARVLPVAALAGKKLDGRLDDETYWLKVRTLPLVDVVTGNHPPRGLGTSVRVFRSGNALYFGIYCTEPDMANLNMGTIVNGERDLRTGDFVEVLFETTSHSYYRLTVSPDGTLLDVDCGDGVEEDKWVSHAEVAVYQGENFWSVEMRVPLAGDNARELERLSGVSGRMPSDTYPWYFNVGRQRVRDGEVQRFAVSPTGEMSFEVPERFARMWSR